VLVSNEFMKLKRSCMDLLREESLGLSGRATTSARGSELYPQVVLAESADAAV
jgi:hypothetical protein